MPGPIATEDLVLNDDPGISPRAVLLGGRGGRFENFQAAAPRLPLSGYAIPATLHKR